MKILQRDLNGSKFRCVRNEEECVCSVCLFRCNIFSGVRIIKEMPCLVDSGTPYIISWCTWQTWWGSSKLLESERIKENCIVPWDKHRWEDNIKMDLKTGWEVWSGFIWLSITTSSRLLRTLQHFQGPQNVPSLTAWQATGFSRTLLHGVCYVPITVLWHLFV
jgi:hypothetical protein